MIYLGIIFFVLLVLKVCCTSWIYRVIGVKKFGGKFDHYFFKSISDRLNYVCGRQLEAIPQHADDLLVSFIILFLCVFHFG